MLGASSNNAGSAGIDDLARRINRDLTDYALTTQVFDSYEGTVFSFNEVGSNRGTDFLNQLDNVKAVGTIGYSAGGLSAIRTAKNQTSKPVDLLVQIESYEPLTGRSNEDEVLPDNVRTGINYYQERNRFNVFRPGFDSTDLQGATNVRGSKNINMGPSDFTKLKGVEITINGKPFEHLIYHYRLAYSGWQYAQIIQGGERLRSPTASCVD